MSTRRNQIRLTEIFSLKTILIIGIIFHCNGKLKFKNLCYAQEPDQININLLQEVQVLFDRATVEEIPTFAPMNFAGLNKYYQTLLARYESGEASVNINSSLRQLKTQLEAVFEMVSVVKKEFQDLITLREEARRLPPGQEQSRKVFFNAENLFQKTINQAENRNIETARRTALEGELSYRKAILISLQEGILKEATTKLEILNEQVSTKKYKELANNLEVAENHFKQAQTPGIAATEFLNLIEIIKSQVQQILNYTFTGETVTELPDLVIDELDVNPEQPRVGEGIEIRALIRNIGMAPAGESLIIFLICGEHELTYSMNNYLEPGQFEEANITTTMPELNECLITALVDPEDKIKESQERNNMAQRNIIVKSETTFFEEVPGWNMPELAVTKLIAEPDRINSGEIVTLSTIVSNIGTGKTNPARLIFMVDNKEISRSAVGPLLPKTQAEFSATWIATGPGRHIVDVTLEIAHQDFEHTLSNNRRTAFVRVAGEAYPEPALEFSEIDFDALQLNLGGSHRVPLKVRNPGFASIDMIPFTFHIDWEQVSSGAIENLAPGEERILHIPWIQVTPGEHVVSINMDLPDTFPEADFKGLRSWHAIVPDRTVLINTPQKDQWTSLGPSILDNGWGGRVNCLAFHPTKPDTMYVGGLGDDGGIYAAPGIFKTLDGGKNWFPIGDKLPSMMIGSIAVDPVYPDKIVYAGSGQSPRCSQGKGIFKSLDGGQTWWIFAGIDIATGVGKLVIRYPKPDQILIYAATDKGVLRYQSNDPFAQFSMPNQWYCIKKGNIRDMVVHPTNNSIVYASVENEALFRTTVGEVAKEDHDGNNDWIKLDNGIPANLSNADGRWLVLDTYKPDPKILVAGVGNPGPGIALAIYRTTDSGDSWTTIRQYAIGEIEGVYLPYIRVRPASANPLHLSNVIYFGGLWLFQLIESSQFASGGIDTYWVHYVYQDLKGLEFHPNNPDVYYSLGDQGIFRSEVKLSPKIKKIENYQYGESGDMSNNLNNGLTVTEFYDIDVSWTNPNRIIGGTQDAGTLLYEGKPEWRMIKDGDGLYSLFNPHDDNIMYAQYQSLGGNEPTSRCDQGGNCQPGTGWVKANINGLPVGHGYDRAYITADPRHKDAIIAVGDDLYFTNYWGMKWGKAGVTSAAGGTIKRVVVNPKTYAWIAGASNGMIYYLPVNGIWYTIFTHPYYQSVASLAISPADPNILFLTFSTHDTLKDTRIWYIELDNANPLNSKAHNITENFPMNRIARVISGDGHSPGIAYVGTNHGVWRWEQKIGGNMRWRPYNNGFPLTTVVDLLVDSNKNLVAATKGRGAWRVITGP